MNPRRLPRAARTPGAAFGKLAVCEARLAWRQPTGLVFGLGLPLLLLVIYGSVPALNRPDKALGGLTFFTVQIPVLIALVVAALALWGLPAPLATYREQGILRRLSTTPAPPSWVLAAQLLVNFCLATLGIVILVVVGIAAFGVDAPRDPAGFVLAVLLTIAALFAIGLWIAAVARSGAAAAAIGSAVFFPLMFFGGLWVPREVMPAVLRTVSDLTPLGAAVQAIKSAALLGAFPPATCLLVLLAYAVVFGLMARRFFRWE